MWSVGAARICRYKDSCLLTRKGRPVIRTIKSCDWSPNTAERREPSRLDGPVLANAEDGMWVSEKKKWRWDRESERRRESCLIRRTGWGTFFFFPFKRDDRWKERLRRDVEKKWKNETKETAIKRKRRSDKSKGEGSATETPLTCSQV